VIVTRASRIGQRGSNVSNVWLIGCWCSWSILIFDAVGRYYLNFPQATDEEVKTKSWRATRIDSCFTFGLKLLR